MLVKKMVALLLVLCIAVTLLPAAAFASNSTVVAYPVTGGNIYFNPTTGNIEHCDFSVTIANIPNEINGVTVKGIQGAAFRGCDRLTNVTLPRSITDISNFAFMDCRSLITIVIPDSVTTIYQCAFQNCSSLTSIFIPNSVTQIWAYAFSGCYNLENIYYSGGFEDWNYEGWESIYVEENGNEPLRNATIHYNSTGPGTGSTQPAQSDPAPDPTEPSQPSPSAGATEPSQPSPSTETINPTQATKKLIFAKFEAFDVFTNTVFLYDDVFAGTELRYEVPENVPININGLMDKWVFCEVLEGSFGSKLISIKEAQVKHQLIIRPNPITQISYKQSDNKGQLRFLGDEYKSFSEFEIPIDITLVNYFSISDPQYGDYSTEDEIPAEWLQRLQSDYSLHYLIYGIETEAPYGFNFGEDGTPKISKYIDLGVGGEFRDIHGYIRADDSFVPVTSTNQSFQYTIRGQIETIGGNWNFSIPFHIRTEASEGNADNGSGQDDKKLNEKTENWAEKFLKNINDLRDVDVTAKGFSLNQYFNKSELEDIDKYIVFWQAICNSEPAKRAQNLPEYLKIEGCKIDGRKVLIVIENKDFFDSSFASMNAIYYKIIDVNSKRIKDQGLYKFSVSASAKQFATKMKEYLKKEYGDCWKDFFKKMGKEAIKDMLQTTAKIDGKEYINTMLSILEDYTKIIKSAKDFMSVGNWASDIIKNPFSAKAMFGKDYDKIVKISRSSAKGIYNIQPICLL